MFVLLLVVALMLCAVVIALPYLLGLTTIEKNDKAKKKTLASASSYTGDGSSTEKSLKDRALEKVHVSSSDMPIRIRLNDSNSTLRSRKEKLSLDTDPNNYDYDLDQLIDEERYEGAKRQQQEFYKNEKIGGEKEEMV